MLQYGTCVRDVWEPLIYCLDFLKHLNVHQKLSQVKTFYNAIVLNPRFLYVPNGHILHIPHILPLSPVPPHSSLHIHTQSMVTSAGGPTVIKPVLWCCCGFISRALRYVRPQGDCTSEHRHHCSCQITSLSECSSRIGHMKGQPGRRLDFKLPREIWFFLFWSFKLIWGKIYRLKVKRLD